MSVEIVIPEISLEKSEASKKCTDRPNDTSPEIGGSSKDDKLVAKSDLVVENVFKQSIMETLDGINQASELAEVLEQEEWAILDNPEETQSQLEAEEKSNEKLSSELLFEKDKNSKLASELSMEKEKNNSLAERLQSVINDLKKTRRGKTNHIKKWKRKFEAMKLEKEKSLLNISDASDESVSSSNQSTSEPDSLPALTNRSVEQSSECWKIRHDEVCHKLETSEQTLEVQQEMNARITAVVAETRQKYSTEIAALKEVIQKMGATAEKHEEELVQIKLLERTKLEVLISALEDEKQIIREKCDVLINELESSRKELKDQKDEAKRRFENEVWKLKKAAKMAEKRRSSIDSKLDEATISSNRNAEASKVVTDLTLLQELVENGLSSDTTTKVNELLNISIQAVKEMAVQIQKLETSLGDSFSNLELKDQALNASTKTHERLVKEHEDALRSEKEKYEALQKMIEETMEQEDVSAKRWKDLSEQENLLREHKKRLGKESGHLEEREKIMVDEKASLEKEKIELIKCLVQKNHDYEKQAEEKLKLQRSLAIVTKQLQESLTPKKDRIVQLESRLETIQSSAKMQQKRLENDLVTAQIQIEKLTTINDELHLLNEELQQKTSSADDICSSLSQELEDSVKTTSELRKIVSILEDENKSLMLANGGERAGLVNELVATKEKLKESQNAVSMQAIKSNELESLEEQLKIAKIQLEEVMKQAAAMNLSGEDAMESLSPSNGMFPDLDPLLRELVHILASNQNYMYGILGIVTYIFLIHLYILL